MWEPPGQVKVLLLQLLRPQLSSSDGCRDQRRGRGHTRTASTLVLQPLADCPAVDRSVHCEPAAHQAPCWTTVNVRLHVTGRETEARMA